MFRTPEYHLPFTFHHSSLLKSADVHVPHSQHFQKIRNQARSGGSNDGGSSPVQGNPRVSKPTSAKRSTPKKSKSTADSFSTPKSSFTQGYDYANNEDDDDDMVIPTSSNKRKRVMKMEGDGQSAPLFKVEGQGGERKPIDLDDE